MALIPTRYDHSVFFPGPAQEDWQEGTGGMSVTTGWYENPARDEDIMVQSTKSVLNQFGHEISTVEEEWQYEVAGGPPLLYKKTEYSRCYMPGIGGFGYRKVGEEETVFWTLSPLTSANNLGRTRYVSGYVVYDVPLDPTKSTSGDAAAKTQDAGMKPGNLQDRIVASGKMWKQATDDSSVVQEPDASQRAVWMANVIEEHDLVEEEWDKWTLWTMKKNRLRPGVVDWDGPRFVKKENVVYRLPVPLDPPTISLVTGTNGVQVQIEGGGAAIFNPYFGPSGTFYIRPERYHVFRAKLVEGVRTPDNNMYGMWLPGQEPAAEPQRRMIGNDAVVDYDGVATSALPGQQSYTEPEDPTPPEPEPDTSFRLIATVDNTNGQDTPGAGEWFDTDLETNGEYEYYATCLVREDESTDSNHEQTTFTGTGSRSYRITVRSDDDGTTQRHGPGACGTTVDAVAPDDPDLPPADYGELFEFEVPTMGDPLEVGRTIMDSQFAARRKEDFAIKLEVLQPLLGLEYAQLVRLPSLNWEAYGNGIHMTTSVEAVDWSLVGFKLTVERNPDGKWRDATTQLHLQQFPRV